MEERNNIKSEKEKDGRYMETRKDRQTEYFFPVCLFFSQVLCKRTTYESGASVYTETMYLSRTNTRPWCHSWTITKLSTVLTVYVGQVSVKSPSGSPASIIPRFFHIHSRIFWGVARVSPGGRRSIETKSRLIATIKRSSSVGMINAIPSLTSNRHRNARERESYIVLPFISCWLKVLSAKICTEWLTTKILPTTEEG
jgi:hypothetical protein